MAKLAAKKKPTKPDAPKKPTSRSKTGNAECSQAASNWQLSIRGKATLNPGTYQTLAKCRALSKSGQMADAQGRTGKLSAMGEQAVKARLQSRFDAGLITQKSRNDRLNMLLKQRSERGNAVVGKGITVNKADFERRIGGPAKPQAEEPPKPKSSMAEGRTNRALDKTMGFNGIVMTRRKAIEDRVNAGAKIALSPKGTRRLMNPDGSFLDESQISKTAMDYAERLATPTPPKPAEPARYSLGGKLAPGRGTEERNKASGILKNLRSRNNDGRTIARSIRDNAVHEWGRWGTGKTSVGNDPAFRAKRILNQSEQMRASYESSYADSVIAADKLVTKTGKLSVPGIRGDANTSFYSTMMPAEMAVKKRLESLRASASTALNHVRIMKQAGIPETGFIAKPKATKDYRKNPLTRLRAAVKLSR